MEQLIINYDFGRQPLANPDGSIPAELINTKLTGGPGASPLGEFGNALDFSSGGYVSTSLPMDDQWTKFCIRLLFKVDNIADPHQRLLRGNCFSLYVDRGETTQDFVLEVILNNRLAGPSKVTSRNRMKLEIQRWYLADIIYDNDTLGVALDEKMVAVNAFPEGTLRFGNKPDLQIGAEPDSPEKGFRGSLAALKIFQGIPAPIENRLDEQRIFPEWQITYKNNQLKPGISLGTAIGAISYDDQLAAYVQNYDNGCIAFNEQWGNTCEMHGGIFQFYRSQPSWRLKLGSLVTDELPAGKAGSRKNAFSKGAVYWSARTGAVPVLGKIYAHFEAIGESKHAIGLPTAPEKPISGGWMQAFEQGQIYYRQDGPSAQEISGAIFSGFQKDGGLTKLGYPVSGVQTILKNKKAIGSYCQFEKGRMYYSSKTGAHFVPAGRILDEYDRCKGPLGTLGFPTSSPFTVRSGNKQYTGNTFENGTLIDAGNRLWIREPFRIFLDGVSTKETEGWGRGENDLYMYFTIKVDGKEVLKKRFPDKGEFVGRNVVDDLDYNTPMYFTVNRPETKIYLELDIWESDGSLNDDDHPGTFRKELNSQNLWGLLDSAENVFNSGPFQGVNYVKWSIRPKVLPGTPLDFWDITSGSPNPKTPQISEAQFAAAFRDVDSEPEWYDPSDWVKQLYYEIVKGIASGGNCFGLSTEAVYGWKDLSLFSRPLRNYHIWDTIKNEVNIKHCYQVGAEFIWWFAEQFVRGNTSDAKEVFRKSRECAQRGDTPVLCVAENYFSGGAKHCVLPITWDDSRKPWRIQVFDPNHRNDVKVVEIDPDKNTHHYKPSGTAYDGRMLYTPWSVLCRPPRTPFWELMALLTAGVVIFMGNNAETTELTDSQGNSLDALRDPVSSPAGKFLPFHGIDQAHALKGELLMGLPTESGQMHRDFRHSIKGIAEGTFDYCLKPPLNEYGIQGNIKRGEQNVIALEKAGTNDQMISFNASNDQMMNLTLTRKLSGTDRMRVVISNIPAKANLNLQFGAPPNLHAIDLLHGGVAPEATILVESTLNGKLSRQEYQTRSEAGMRLFLSPGLVGANVKMAAIDQLKGSGFNYSILRRK